MNKKTASCSSVLSSPRGMVTAKPILSPNAAKSEWHRKVTYFDVPLSGWPGEQEYFIHAVKYTRNAMDFEKLMVFNPQLMGIWLEVES